MHTSLRVPALPVITYRPLTSALFFTSSGFSSQGHFRLSYHDGRRERKAFATAWDELLFMLFHLFPAISTSIFHITHFFRIQYQLAFRRYRHAFFHFDSFITSHIRIRSVKLPPHYYSQSPPKLLTFLVTRANTYGLLYYIISYYIAATHFQPRYQPYCTILLRQ